MAEVTGNHNSINTYWCRLQLNAFTWGQLHVSVLMSTLSLTIIAGVLHLCVCDGLHLSGLVSSSLSCLVCVLLISWLIVCVCSLHSFGKQLGGRRGCECITLEPSEMIVVSRALPCPSAALWLPPSLCLPPNHHAFYPPVSALWFLFPFFIPSLFDAPSPLLSSYSSFPPFFHLPSPSPPLPPSVHILLNFTDRMWREITYCVTISKPKKMRRETPRPEWST